MQLLRKTVCLMLVSILLLSCALPVGASETVPEETVLQETAETVAASEDPELVEDPALLASKSGSMSFDTSGLEAKEKERGSVPLFLQTNYPDVGYSGGSLATSGCTITCVAMVATCLSGKEVSPPSLARRFKKYEASNIQRMEAASTVLDLEYRKTTQWKDVEKALRDGKIVTILVGKASPFTSSQHTVVLTGISEDGKIFVNDPYGPNYKKVELKAGFANGFAPGVVKTGFDQAWIYEGYEPTDTSHSRYPEMELTDEEEDLIASLIWLEARGESFQGQQAIAEIVFNRLCSGEFNDTVEGTIRADGQFRTAKFLEDAEPGALQYKAIEKALAGPNVLPMDVYYFARQAPNPNVWGRIGGHVFCYAE